MKKLFIATAAFAFAAQLSAEELSDAEFYKFTNYNPDATAADIRFEDFASPKGNARVQTWWHWINGNVSREGIEADLKAMGENNYGAAIIFNLGSDSTPAGALKFNSPEWFDTFKFTVETAKKYGVDIGIHNCDGWSEAGGPWITPEMSMKKLTFSTVRATGNGKLQTFKLPVPPTLKDYYEDIAVVAYPAFRPLEVAVEKHVKAVKAAGDGTADNNVKAMFDGDIRSVLFARGKSGYKNFGIELELDAPFEAAGAYIDTKWSWKLPSGMYIEASDDGKTFEKVCDLNFTAPSVVVKFPARKAKFWRIMRQKTNQEFQDNFGIAALELIPPNCGGKYAPYITALPQKNASARHHGGLAYDDVPVPQNAIVKGEDVKVFRGELKADGTFEWLVPDGEWEIRRLGFTTNGVGVHPATEGGRGLESDKLSAKATDFHFDSYAAKMIDAAGANAGSVFKYVETDSWECGQQNWTRGLDKEFEEFNGYDIDRWLPVLMGEVVDGKKQTEAFAADFRALTSYLVTNNFYGRMGERIRSRGLKYETEPLMEASLSNQVALFKFADIPQDEIWQGYRSVDKNAVPDINQKGGCALPHTVFAVDASHFFGKAMTTCESLTQMQGNWGDAPLALKGKVDTILLSGMNVLVFHSYTHQPDETVPGWQMEPWGSCINRKMPWFGLSRAFFDYIARSQYMFQQGKARVPLAFLMTEEIPVKGYFNSISETYGTVDKINAECVRDYMRVVGEKMTTPGRMKYDVLYIDPKGVFKVETMRALKRLAEQGAAICGEKLKFFRALSDGADGEAEWSKLNGELFGDGSKKIVKIGKGRVYVGYSAKDALEAEGVKEFVKFSPNFVAVRKRFFEGGSSWYYFANCADGARVFDADFDEAGKNIEIWNPETAERIPVAAFREMQGRTRITISLRKNDSMFVVFSGAKKGAGVAEYSVDKKRVFPHLGGNDFDENAPRPRFEGGALNVEFFKAGRLDASLSDGSKVCAAADSVRPAAEFKTPFVVEFQQKFGAPASAEFEKFISWTEHSDIRVKNYSGVGKYILKIDLPKLDKNEKAYVDFEKIMEVGRVSVNGKPAGVLWKAPFRLDITSFARAGENTVEVEVGNTWVNRCLYDATLPKDGRVTWSNSMDFHFPEAGKKLGGKAWRQGAIPSGVIGAPKIIFSKTETAK